MFEVPICPHPCQHLSLSIFSIIYFNMMWAIAFSPSTWIKLHFFSQINVIAGFIFNIILQLLKKSYSLVHCWFLWGIFSQELPIKHHWLHHLVQPKSHHKFDFFPCFKFRKIHAVLFSNLCLILLCHSKLDLVQTFYKNLIWVYLEDRKLEKQYIIIFIKLIFHKHFEDPLYQMSRKYRYGNL